MMRYMKKSLRQEIFCLRKIERFLRDHSPPQTPWRISSGTGRSREVLQAKTVDIFSVVHRSLSDPFVPANREMVQI